MIQGFLRELFEGKPDHLSIVIWSLPSKASEFCANVASAAKAAQERQRGDVYFGVALHDATKIQTHGSRGDTDSAAAIVGLWADLDICGPTHKGNQYPPDETAAMALLKEMPVQPTLIVKSGGGLQPWWLFVEPWVFESEEEKSRAQRMSSGWQALLKGMGAGKGWTLDNTSDLARVLRVPGTFNRKSGSAIPVTYEVVGQRFNPSDFEQWMAEERPAPDMPPVTSSGDWRSRLSRSTMEFLAVGAPDGQRNNRLFAAACDMAGSGVPFPEAQGLLHHAASVSGLDDEEATRTIDEAYSKPRSPAKPEEITVGSAFQHMEMKPEGVEAKATAEATPTPFQVVRPLVGNIQDGTREMNGEEKSVRYYVPPERIAAAIFEATGSWPKSVNGQLFVYSHHPERLPEPRDLTFLNKQAKLFAYIHEHCCLRWNNEACIDAKSGRVQNPIGKDEFYEFVVKHPSAQFQAVEVLPQQPAVPETWYAPIDLPPVVDLMKPEQFKASPLGKLLEAMNADTPADRLLLLAAMMTPGWGGMPGGRPAFVFASDYGRGSGKTTTAEVIAEIWGGYIGIRAGEEQERIIQRLLSPASAAVRIALMDNIKGHLSDGILESIVTAKTIDGHQLHVGQTTRRNTLTWFLTANTPMLSKDLSERSVVIKIGRQSHGTEFKPWALHHVAEHRRTIMAQLLYLLAKPQATELKKEFRDRWLTWQNGVLCRLNNANEVMQAVIERRGQVDSDSEQAEEIKACIVAGLKAEARVDYQRAVYAIPRQLLHQWLLAGGVVDDKKGVRYTTTVCRAHAGSGPLECLSYRLLRNDGSPDRFWVWRGPDASPDAEHEFLEFRGAKWE